MQFIKEISLSKEILRETQYRKALDPDDLMAISSLNSRLKGIFLNIFSIGVLSSVFIRILLARYQILIRGFYHYLIIPGTMANYYMIYEYPGYHKGVLQKTGLFLNKKEEGNQEYEQKRGRLLNVYKRKFYTNSQFWH